jgi:ferrous iron transport protein B
VGNWAGVTVEKKTGRIRRRGREAEITDLRRLLPFATLARRGGGKEFLCTKGGLRDLRCGFNSAGAGVYLALQILALGRKAVLAMNMADELKSRAEASI